MKQKKYYLTWQQYDKDIRKLSESIKKQREFSSKLRFIAPIMRGGAVPTIHLSHLLNLRVLTEFDVSDLENEQILFVDDVSDTGKTLKKIDCNPDYTATLYRKDLTIFEPRFFVRTINQWIVCPWEH